MPCLKAKKTKQQPILLVGGMTEKEKKAQKQKPLLRFWRRRRMLQENDVTQ